MIVQVSGSVSSGPPPPPPHPLAQSDHVHAVIISTFNHIDIDILMSHFLGSVTVNIISKKVGNFIIRLHSC